METNFKVDMPSFALGYSAGKKKGGGGGVELNIAYGDTPPEDTSKLWVKTAEPNGVLISPEVEETEVDVGESYYTMRATLPYPVAQAGCGVVGSKIYIIGGMTNDGTGNIASKSVTIYDTETRKFEVLKDVLGEGIVNICCAVVGTRIYFVGGGALAYTKSNKIRYFDTETNQLVTCNSTLPTELYGFVCGSLDNAVYIFGGRGSSYPKTAYRFETETDTYSSLGDVKSTFEGRCARKGSVFYIFGDANGSGYILRYDSASHVTGQKDIFGSASGCAGGILGDYIYAIGGYNTNSILRFDINKYDDYNPKKEQMPITTHKKIGYSACATVGNKIYAFGGSDSGSTTIKPIDEVNVYSLATPVPSIEEGSLYVKPQTGDNIFTIINAESAKIEIGVDTVYKGNAEGIGEEVEAALYKDGAWITI